MTAQVITLFDHMPTAPRLVEIKSDPCEVVILPVVRVERHADRLPNPFTDLSRSRRPHDCGND